MIILGIGGILNDAAAAVLKDGVLAGAVEQRKLARRTLPGELPEEAIASVLELAHATPAEVDCVAVVRPLAEGPEVAHHMELRARFPNSRIVLVDHHTAHAASVFYPSPFEQATVLTIDRAGDFRCGARWRASAGHIELEQEQYYPDSLGDLYRRVTELAGFDPEADPHKLQWLSTTSDERMAPLFLEVLGAAQGGWPRVDRTFFDSDRLSQGGFSAKFYQRLGLDEGAPVPGKLRAPLAAGLQRAIEQTVLEMAGDGENLCLAGGLFLNALLVSRVEWSQRWKNVFVQPAAGNAGTALGAVYHAWHQVYQQPRGVGFGNLCLGPSFEAEEIKKVLENC
ncbi:MAG TPA: carbamoyltransferase N-terminal domain-containing protein [Bryobacteraceae bacterium]